MEPRRRNTGVDLNLKIKALQQDLADLRQRLEWLENQYEEEETGMQVDLDDNTPLEDNYPF